MKDGTARVTDHRGSTRASRRGVDEVVGVPFMFIEVALLPQLLVADFADGLADHKPLNPQQHTASHSKHSADDGNIQTPVGRHLPTAYRSNTTHYRCWDGGNGVMSLMNAQRCEKSKTVL